MIHSLSPTPTPPKLKKSIVYMLMVVVCGGLIYYPHLFTFVGTDLGVYYELGRRLAEDGHLRLWENYWDHKPPSYAIFALFPFLDHLIGPNWGLKIGAFCVYIAAILIAQFALLREAGNTRSPSLSVWMAIALVAVSFGWLDFALNGILLVTAVCLSFSGLALAGAIGCRRPYWQSILAGLLIGLSPLFRPTAITTFAILSLGVLLEVRGKNMACVTRAWIVAALTLALAALLTLSATGGPANAWETLIHYNAAYRSMNAGSVAVLEFFAQDRAAFFITAAALLFILPVQHIHRATWRAWTLPCLWMLVELASMTWQRKIQSFYVLGFALPVLLIAAFIPATIKNERPAKLATLLFAAILAAALPLSWSRLSPALFDNRPIDQGDQLTSILPALLGLHPCPQWDRPTLFVYGNRAQLYTNAVLNGISPFKWPAYANPLIDSSSVSGKATQLFQQWIDQPPEFVIYAGGPGWDPNIGGRSSFIEEQIAARYEEIPVSAIASGTEWPYQYVYRVYRRKCANPAE